MATPSIYSLCTPDLINLRDKDALHNDYADLERPPGKNAKKDHLNKRKSKDHGNV